MQSQPTSIRAVKFAQQASISFLNFDKGRYFTAIVRKRNYSRFAQPVQQLYGGKFVQIRGVISEYRDKPQIEIFGPDQITALDQLEPIPPEPKKTPRTFSGVVTLASYNVLNLFDEYDDPYHQDGGTDPKPRDQLDELAKTIHRIDADVIALQEVENRGYLERFVRAMLPDMGYEHVVCFEGNDRRGIDCAVLSRLPVGPVTSYRHLRFPDGEGGMMSFRRDLIRVRIEPNDHPGFDVLVVHLKSKRGGGRGERVRLAEAQQARRLMDDMLRQDRNARFVICGDFNDTWESKALQAIRGEGKTALKTFVEDFPKGIPSYNREPHRSIIDFILCSPAMASGYVPDSYRIRPGTVETSGSDHNPVAIQVDLRSK
ncbi:MAG: endonuclease/exonuclease/phosphatase family protein [Phycisphaerae bacterium]